eukprot:214288_1
MFPLICLLLVIQESFAATCDSTTYSTKVQNELTKLASDKGYKITEGIISIQYNSTYTVSNPNSAYGVYVFTPIIDPQITYEWKLLASDAVIFAGCTMPKGKYFSFQHYVNERYVGNKKQQLFADLGATVNNLDINTSSTDTFDALTTVVLTGDKQTALDISTVLDPKTTNILSIPNKYVYYSPPTNNTFDTFSMLYRMALWDNNTEFEQYVNTVNNMSIWKLSFPNNQKSVPRTPYDPYVRDINCSYNEAEIYKSAVNEYATDLIKYIETTYKYKYISTVPFVDSQVEPDHYYGFDCITYNYNCIGETRDAVYWGYNSYNSSILYDDKSFFLMLGVNHDNTKQTEYIGITLYDYIVNEGEETKGDLSSRELNQSALLLPVNTNVKKEYVSNMWLTQLSRPMNCLYDNNELVIPGFCCNSTEFSQKQFLLVTRNYLNPETKTHPNKEQIVGPVLLYFQA